YQPSRLEDLTALNALYRPGPIQGGMVDDFIERKWGRKAVQYDLPELKELLEETYGVIVYQEQVMQISNRLAGYSLGDADLLRRAMGKKKLEEMAKQRERFVQDRPARAAQVHGRRRRQAWRAVRLRGMVVCRRVAVRSWRGWGKLLSGWLQLRERPRVDHRGMGGVGMRPQAAGRHGALQEGLTTLRSRPRRALSVRHRRPWRGSVDHRGAQNGRTARGTSAPSAAPRILSDTMQSDNKKRPRTAPTAGGRTQEDLSPMPATKGSRAPERGHRVAQARKRAGLTQPQLAEKIGVGRVSIARIEAGRQSPSVVLALKIARELGEPVEALFGGER
ncbi:MAG: helix-turn-helix domain-containing protein, partial [Solirubrobacteraceae bacterium]